jgi:hypothetical protein
MDDNREVVRGVLVRYEAGLIGRDELEAELVGATWDAPVAETESILLSVFEGASDEAIMRLVTAALRAPLQLERPTSTSVGSSNVTVHDSWSVVRTRTIKMAI